MKTDYSRLHFLFTVSIRPWARTNRVRAYGHPLYMETPWRWIYLCNCPIENTPYNMFFGRRRSQREMEELNLQVPAALLLAAL